MVESSEAESKEKHPPRGPQWVPYAPPQRSFQARLRQTVRRYAFPVAFLLSLAVVVGVLVFYTPLQASWGGGADQAAPVVAADPPPARLPDPYAGETVFSVASQPAGAEVVLGTDTLGRTPLEQRATRAGAYVLTVHKEGYAAVDSVVFLHSDQPLALRLRLLPEESIPEKSIPEKSTSEGRVSEAERSEAERSEAERSEAERSEAGDSARSQRAAGRSAAAPDSASAEEREAAKARLAAQQRAERYRALRDEGDRLYAQRKFEAAIEHYQASLRYRPGDAYATGRIQEIRKRLSVVGW